MVVDATKRHNNSSKSAEKRLTHIPEALKVLGFNLISCRKELLLGQETRHFIVVMVVFLFTTFGKVVKFTPAQQNYQKIILIDACRYA